MVHMVGKMRDDINMIISAMLHTENHVDFSRILTRENMFDASIIRSFLLQALDEEEFEEDMLDVSDDFVRGIVSGLMLSIMIQKRNNEPLGSPSHADIVDLYDCGIAYLAEKAIK